MPSVHLHRSRGARPLARGLQRLVAAMFGAAAISLGVAGGCVSPTLPLPPPGSPDSLRPLEDGRWEVQGDCNPGAQIIGIVERTGEGAVVEDRDADGRFRFVVEAERCDVVLLTQADGDEVSSSTRVVLVTTTQGRVADDGGCSR